MGMIVYSKLRNIKPGDKIDSAWGNAVVAAINSITPIAGKNIEISRTKNGTIIRASFDDGMGNSDGDGGTDFRIVPVHPDPSDPDAQLPLYVRNSRCVVDWKYDPSDNHRIKVLYGTLTLANGILAIVPDNNNGTPIWSTSLGDGPFGGGGTQAERESF